MRTISGLRPPAPNMTTMFVAMALPVAALFSVLAAMRDHFAGDLFLTRAIQDVRVGPWSDTMEAASSIGGLLPAAAIAMAIFAWLLYKKRSAECWLSAGALLSLAAIPILKFLVDRPRPTEDMVEVTHRIGGLSFPSGHAFTAVVIFGLLYYLAPLLIPWRMGVRIVRMSLLLLVLLIGMSRVYLGVHWPSDVFGGFLFGAITLALLIHLHRQQSSRGEVSQTT